MNDYQTFQQIGTLLKLAWPAVSQIDWSEYCAKSVAPHDGVPKYTGILMYRGGFGCIGATTAPVGFLPRPELSAQIVLKKTRLCVKDPGTLASIQHRDLSQNHWGGGIRIPGTSQAYAITGLPEIADHILLQRLMLISDILDTAACQRLEASVRESLRQAMEFVGMSDDKLEELTSKLAEIVAGAFQELILSGLVD